jgi:hypothetical protein
MKINYLLGQSLAQACRPVALEAGKAGKKVFFTGLNT